MPTQELQLMQLPRTRAPVQARALRSTCCSSPLLAIPVNSLPRHTRSQRSLDL